MAQQQAPGWSANAVASPAAGAAEGGQPRQQPRAAAHLGPKRRLMTRAAVRHALRQQLVGSQQQQGRGGEGGRLAGLLALEGAG
jgi:hypothetical protein